MDVVRVPTLLGTDVSALSTAPRRTPVRLHRRVIVKETRLKLSPHLLTDELPEAAQGEAAGIRFDLAVGRDRDEVVLKRRLEIDQADVPIAEQNELRVALTKIRAADATPVVLRRR